MHYFPMCCKCPYPATIRTTQSLGSIKRNVPAQIFEERYQQHGTPLAVDVASGGWHIQWHPDQQGAEQTRQQVGDPFQQDVLDMGDTALLCCPEDHR